MSEQQDQMATWDRDIVSRIETLSLIQKGFSEEMKLENHLLRIQITVLTAEREKLKQELVRVQEEVKKFSTETKHEIEKLVTFSVEEIYFEELAKIARDVEFLLNMKDYSGKDFLKSEHYGMTDESEFKIDRKIRELTDQLRMYMEELKEALASKLEMARQDQEECQKIHVGQTVSLWRSFSNQLNDSVSKSIEKCFRNITSESKITLLAGSEIPDKDGSDAVNNLYMASTTKEEQVPDQQEQQKMNVLQSESISQIENLIASQETVYKKLTHESSLLRDQLSALSAQHEKVTEETISCKEEVGNISNEMRAKLDSYIKLRRERQSKEQKHTFASLSQRDTLKQPTEHQQEMFSGRKELVEILPEKKELIEILSKKKERISSCLEEYLIRMKSLIRKHRYIHSKKRTSLGRIQFTSSEPGMYEIPEGLEKVYVQQDIDMNSLKSKLESEFKLTRLVQEEWMKLHTEKIMNLWKELCPQVNYSVSKCIKRCFDEFQQKQLLVAEIKPSDDTEKCMNIFEVIKKKDFESEKKEEGQGTDLHIKNFNFDWLNITSAESLATIYIKHYLWMKPLPTHQEFRVNLAEVYVEPDLQVIGRNPKWSQVITMENIFENVSNVSSPIRRVLLVGDIGSGKTSLCMKSAIDWSLGTTTFVSFPWNTTLLLFFELRKLSQKADLELELINFIKPSLSQKLKRRDSDLVQKLRSLQRNLLVILDGFDELDSERQNEVKRFISVRDDKLTFSESTILVCSRPSAADSDLLAMFEKIVTIDSFSEEKMHLLMLNLNRHCLPTKGEKKKQLHTASSPAQEVLAEVLANMEKPIDLLTMSPLMISVFYWIVKKPRRKFGDVIYTCIEYLCERCNLREGFGYTIQQIRDTLCTCGFFWIHTKLPFFAEEPLRKALGARFALLSLSGVIKRSGECQLGEFLWEPTRKSFIHTIIEHAFHSTDDEPLQIREIQELLENHFSGRIHGSKIRIHCSKGKTRSIYLILSSADGKVLFCKWDENKECLSLAIQEFPRPDPVEIELSFWACSWSVIESIYQRIFIGHRTRHLFSFLNTFNLREYTHWRSYSIMFSYEELSTKYLYEVLYPRGNSLISQLGNEQTFKELKIHVKESSNDRKMVWPVMRKLLRDIENVTIKVDTDMS